MCFTPHRGSSVCVRDRTIHMSSMFAHERLSSFPCSHSSPLTRSSLFLSTSSTPISPTTLPDQEATAPHPRNEAHGPMAIIPPPTRYEPNVTDNFDDMGVTASIFQDSSVASIYDLGDKRSESPDAEIDDEHVRNALASPLYIEEREANASLRQAYHSNAESLFPGAQSILASTGRPVAWLSQNANLAKS